MDRRNFIRFGGLAAGGALLATKTNARAQTSDAEARTAPSDGHHQPHAVVTPNGSTMPWRTVGGVKVGHLIAQAFEHEFAPGLRAECWGYNGTTPGPTIEATEGDHVRIYVTNRLPEPTTLHWHGVPVPNGMDGVAGLTQRPIAPGETYKYEFVFKQAGSFMYHPHFDEMTQMAMGMAGMIVVHPRVAHAPRVDRDFVLMTSEWKIQPGTRRINPVEMTEFNVMTFNSKAFPGTDALLVGRGERIRIRIGNLSAMSHHAIHLHGASFKVTATEGGFISESAQWPGNTVLVPVGAVRVVEFVADAPGDWPLHCHMTHHIMNQMGHALPVMQGVDAARVNRHVQSVVPEYMTMGQDGMAEMADMDMPVPPNTISTRTISGPFSRIDMGGMFTIIKVREHASATDAQGWYEHPEGTVASLVTDAQMRADGIDPHE